MNRVSGRYFGLQQIPHKEQRGPRMSPFVQMAAFGRDVDEISAR